MRQRQCVLPLEFDVLVDTGCNRHGDQSIVPTRDEHNTDAQQHSQEREAPVVVTETRPPVGGAQESLKSASKIDKHVAHKKEPDDRGSI